MADAHTNAGIDLSQLRVDYRQRALSEYEVDRDPFAQFSAWFQQAVEAKATEPNAMTLATCSTASVPSARVVLLKRADPKGFVFFTNYDSAKGRELHLNPVAALVFWWPELERQVRVEGSVGRTSDAESDDYFAKRPFASRIGAAASAQSTVLPSRQSLEHAAQLLAEQCADGVVPRPANWGGFIVRPNRFEFWQGRTSRLHDRVEYSRTAGEQWAIRRLAP